ncbi:unnamed protein product [Phaeothamnion confervicola]
MRCATRLLPAIALLPGARSFLFRPFSFTATRRFGSKRWTALVEAAFAREMARRSDLALSASPAIPDAFTLATRHWLQRVVVGLRLCPWAAGVLEGDRLRVVSAAAEHEDCEDLLETVHDELAMLAGRGKVDSATTLIVVRPPALQDFSDFLSVTSDVDALIDGMRLRGAVQLATFHPRYQFDGAAPDDVTNFTNRSPFPTLHLLREDEVSMAVASYLGGDGDLSRVWGRNQELMEELGAEHMAGLVEKCVADGEADVAAVTATTAAADAAAAAAEAEGAP